VTHNIKTTETETCKNSTGKDRHRPLHVFVQSKSEFLFSVFDNLARNTLGIWQDMRFVI